IVPPAIVLFGIPLFRIFASFLTLIEASTGLLFGWLGLHNEPALGMPRKLSVGRLLTATAAVGVGVVEGCFYSRIAAGSGERFTLIDGLSLSFEQIFFGWGFLLVMALFGLGEAAFQALITVISGTAVKAYERAVKRAKVQTALLRQESAALESAAACVRRQAADIQTQMCVRSDLNPVQASLEALRQELRRLADQPPSWADAKEIRVNSSRAVSWLRSRVSIWLVVSLIALTGFVVTSTFTLGWMFPQWRDGLAIAVAMSFGLLLCISGLLAVPKEKYVRDVAGTLVPFFPATSVSVAAALPLVLVVAVLAVIPLTSRGRPSAALAGWLFAVVGGAAVIFACREIGGALPVAALQIWRIVQFFGLAVALLWCCLVQLLAGAV